MNNTLILRISSWLLIDRYVPIYIHSNSFQTFKFPFNHVHLFETFIPFSIKMVIFRRVWEGRVLLHNLFNNFIPIIIIRCYCCQPATAGWRSFFSAQQPSLLESGFRGHLLWWSSLCVGPRRRRRGVVVFVFFWLPAGWRFAGLVN
jgi:hypothetical protein